MSLSNIIRMRNYRKHRPFWVPWNAHPENGPRGLKKYNSFNQVFEWKHLLFWRKPAWSEIKQFLEERNKLGYKVYPGPAYHTIFKCLRMTKFEDVKVVILGQDPYPKEGIADGLAFSTYPTNKKIPGSLRNIFREYREDLGFNTPLTGSLLRWADNGVLLMNSVWTVEDDKPRSHYTINTKQKWQLLTQEIIEQLSVRRDKIVFILWGNEAQKNEYIIHNKERHLILKGAHPSPRNFTWTGKPGKPKFLGGKYFSKTCEFLNQPYEMWKLA